VRAFAAKRLDAGTLVLLCAAAWAVPGAAHWWLGRRAKATVLFVALLAMFATGLAVQGRLFPVLLSDPMVALWALADAGIGGAYVVARMMGLGAGEVRAVTYEYGNAFLVVAGLLNVLVVIDAFDIAMGRK
jgi:Family of unknown function (DUF6677)